MVFMGKARTESADRPRAVKLADVAAQCGLSTAAVSWALRGIRAQVSAETIDRVQAAARELGYDPARHTSARRLAMRRMGVEVLNHLVALLVPTVFHETNYHILMFRGVMDVFTPARYGLLTACPTENTLSALPETFIRGELDGLIVLGALEGSLGLVETLRRHEGFGQRPIVSLTIETAGCSAVLFDDYAGGYALADHLLALGHRHLLVHDGRDFRATQRRLGVLAAYADRQLDPRTYLTEYPWHNDNPLRSGDRLLALLPRQPHITAILGPNDLDTGHIWRRLQGAGYRIPHDYSLVGFDDTDPILDAHGANQLTTVHAPLREAGQIAAQHLLDRITGQAAATTITVPLSLVVRASTAPPPGVR